MESRAQRELAERSSALPDRRDRSRQFHRAATLCNRPNYRTFGGAPWARPRGMMLIRDELAGFFANMTRYRPGSDRPFWLEAWDGGRHVVERVRRSTVVEHLLVGVIGSFQPDKLARAFAGDEDGMASRFLYAWPATPEYRPLTNEASEVEPELRNALVALISCRLNMSTANSSRKTCGYPMRRSRVRGVSPTDRQDQARARRP